MDVGTGPWPARPRDRLDSAPDSTDGTVESFKRLIPCLWPHRRRLTLSIVFGLLVAFLWGANISAVYPAVMMLVQGKDLHQYVSEEVDKTHESIRKHEEILERIDEQLAELEASGHGEDSNEYMELLGDRVKNQRRLHSTTRTLWQLTWLQNNAMPWIPRRPLRRVRPDPVRCAGRDRHQGPVHLRPGRPGRRSRPTCRP